jgi:hypothetical protein
MKKTPAGGTRPGSRTHAYRTGAGAWGLGRGPVSVEFEPANFPRLYQTAHSESTVDKWNNFFIGVVAGEARSAPDHGAKKPPSLQLNSRIGRRNLRNRPQGFPAISGKCLAFATTDVDLSLAVARATFELPPTSGRASALPPISSALTTARQKLTSMRPALNLLFLGTPIPISRRL